MNEHSRSFIRYLQTLKERDKGALAVLRHSLAFEPGTYSKAFSYIERFAGEAAHERDARRLAPYAVAALFARHPHHTENKSFAAAFGELMRRRESDSIERRFIALLGADAENIVDYLRQATSLLAAEDIGCDYARLLEDLSSWMNPLKIEKRDNLRQHWARDFYRAMQPAQATESKISPEATTE
ncbi:MAG: type I-E CRISPR-associated protein Cse2/CasB [Azoarcus sp.]|jgi:CRISPR system Cascade subunit CasB|nr:type I-E CRISPR-associated protein Cse2/CasB [Azoarcus sp.]